MKKVLVIGLALILALSLMGCGKSKPATEVDRLISSIGEVTLDSEEAIIEAEEYYDTLSSGQKDEVENYKTLVDARKAFDVLLAEDASIVGTWRQLWEVGDDKELMTTEEVEELLDKDVEEMIAEFTDDNRFRFSFDGDNSKVLIGTWEYEGSTKVGYYNYSFTVSGDTIQGVKLSSNNRMLLEMGERTIYLEQD